MEKQEKTYLNDIVFLMKYALHQIAAGKGEEINPSAGNITWNQSMSNLLDVLEQRINKE